MRRVVLLGEGDGTQRLWEIYFGIQQQGTDKTLSFIIIYKLQNLVLDLSNFAMKF